MTDDFPPHSHPAGNLTESGIQQRASPSPDNSEHGTPNHHESSMYLRTYLSFWHIEMSNLPMGTFSRRALSRAEASSVVNAARASGTLLCVSKDDLAAPYREHERYRHEELCAALRDHISIEVHLKDFFGENYAYPLCFAEVGKKSRLLVVDCNYDFDDEIRSDSAAMDTLTHDEANKAATRRLQKGAIRMSVAPDSIKFYVFEQVETQQVAGRSMPEG